VNHGQFARVYMASIRFRLGTVTACRNAPGFQGSGKDGWLVSSRSLLRSALPNDGGGIWIGSGGIAKGLRKRG
jgi:hypothetical protein